MGTSTTNSHSMDTQRDRPPRKGLFGLANIGGVQLPLLGGGSNTSDGGGSRFSSSSGAGVGGRGTPMSLGSNTSAGASGGGGGGRERQGMTYQMQQGRSGAAIGYAYGGRGATNGSGYTDPRHSVDFLSVRS